MGIGLSLALIAVGAVLTFAVTFDIAGLDVNVVGWILMLVGTVSMVLTFTYWRPRRRAAVVRRPPPAVEERRIRDEPPGPTLP